jgi:hypothetical protein
MHQITVLSKNALIRESRSEYMVTRERYFDFIASLSNVTQLFRTLKRP